MSDSLSLSQLLWPVPVVGWQLLRVLGGGVALLRHSQLQSLWRGESTVVTEDLFQRTTVGTVSSMLVSSGAVFTFVILPRSKSDWRRAATHICAGSIREQAAPLPSWNWKPVRLLFCDFDWWLLGVKRVPRNCYRWISSHWKHSKSFIPTDDQVGGSYLSL